MFKNKQTGEAHTGKWPAICAVTGGMTLLIIGALEKYTGFPLAKALEIGIPLLAFGGIGFGTMARRG